MEGEPSTKAAKWSKTKLIAVSALGAVLIAVTGFLRGVEIDNTATNKARVEVELLSKAIEAYKLDHGEYPGIEENTPAQGDISEELYMALFYEGWDSQTNGHANKDIYLNELDPRKGSSRMVKKTDSDVPPKNLKLLDPWGRPYRYRKGYGAENPDFDLWSIGPDGKDNTEDDIRNW